MRPTHLPCRALLLPLATLLLAACESKPDRHAMMEEARRAVPPMAASDTFFNGAIAARLTLGSALDNGGAGRVGGTEGLDGRRGGGGLRGGARSEMTAGMGASGMSEGRYGDRGVGGTAGDTMRSSSEGAPMMGNAPDRRMAATAIRPSESRMPPALMRLRLENTTAAAVVVEVREINSELGNFAVRPDKLTLAPGESAAPDPMQSLLGLDTYSLPVTVTLRLGGQTETKVLTLHQVAPADVAPPPSAPPPPAADK
jgi:hypothetical protein